MGGILLRGNLRGRDLADLAERFFRHQDPGDDVGEFHRPHSAVLESYDPQGQENSCPGIQFWGRISVIIVNGVEDRSLWCVLEYAR